jgi:siderophore synthetase component
MNASMTWDRFAAALTSDHYQSAQRRALRQLIEALLFERVLVPEMTPEGHDTVYFHILGRTQEGRSVGYRCLGRISESFGRIRLDASSILRIGAEGARPVASLQEFVLEVGPTIDTDESLLNRFLRELQQTLLKDTLARYMRREDKQERDLTALEGRLQDGHPYHPCYKSRVGFDPVDNFAYGPEFAPPVRLLWLALRRTHASFAVCRDINVDDFLLQELGEAQHTLFTATLRNAGLAPEDYLLLPVHPWQWREKIATDLFPLLQRRDLVWLGEGEDEYRPLQSIRSLANFSNPAASHVKLPISIINTSADRILSCHNVENAPPVSDWLCDVLDQDTALRDTGLVFLREVVGITYRDPDLPPFLQAQQYGMLGAVWRESVDNCLQTGESAAPFSGLCQCEADGQPFIAPWVGQQGLEPWLQALLEASVPPLIHLLYAHGIGMEAHAQNIVLIHRAGKPCRIALKDLPGGLRFVRKYLADPKRCPQLVPMPSFRKQVNATAGMETLVPDEVRDYFHDAVFFINFGELSLFLREHYGLLEADFWARIATCIFAYQARHPELASRFAAFDLFAATIQVEQLAKRRLFAETEARLQQVSNPLYRYRRQVGKEAACKGLA